MFGVLVYNVYFKTVVLNHVPVQLLSRRRLGLFRPRRYVCIKTSPQFQTKINLNQVWFKLEGCALFILI